MNPSVQIENLTLKVSNLKQSLEFYQKYLGLKIISIENDVASLGINNKTLLRLYVPNHVKIPDKAYTGLYHVAFLLPSEYDLALLIDYYLRIGFTAIGTGDHLFSQAIYFNDPDGNGIEIYADRDKTSWKYDAQGYLISATHAVDIRQLLSLTQGALWNGMPEKTRIGHIHLQARSLEAIKKLFFDILDFDITITMPHAIFLSKEAYHHHIGANIWAGTNLEKLPSTMTGLDHYTLSIKNYAFYLDKLKNSELRYEISEDGLIIVDDNDISIKIMDGDVYGK